MPGRRRLPIARRPALHRCVDDHAQIGIGVAFGIAIAGSIFFGVAEAMQHGGAAQATAYTSAFAAALIYNAVVAACMTGLLAVTGREKP
jgi:hypothetical protein